MTTITAAEIARITGREKSTVCRQAQKQAWPHTAGQNRTKLFMVDSLPDEIRLLIYKENTPLPPSRGELASPQDVVMSRPPGGTRSCANPPAPIAGTQLEQINHRQIGLACYKADLLAKYIAALSAARHGRKKAARINFIRAYHGGAWPELLEKIGRTSWKTIEGWKIAVRESGDTFSLADRRGYARRGNTTLTGEQQQVLLRCALNPNQPQVSEVIRVARAVMAASGIENGHSEATYRRWLADWRNHNYHIWVWTREGSQAWNNKCAYSIERDYSLINVGDILVADGHVLNFEIINPWTGKPKRMCMIVFLDMKSSRPCGWEIMPTENTSSIASALRRSILALGKIPRVVYLDNGRAFGAKFFSGVDLSQSGFDGLFSKLNIQTIYAWPYHGQSKTVERFFGTFSELERWCPTYTGTSIEKKPPRLNRGERLHRRVYESMGTGITLAQAHAAVAAWFDEYSARPQDGHLAGAAPDDLFVPGRGPGVDPADLRYLMMAQQIKTIHSQGITFLGQTYYHPALYGRRHPVLIRYDLSDRSYIIVEDPATGEPICVARPPEKCHPAATVLGTDADREHLSAQIEFKKRQEKSASCIALDLLENHVLPEHRKILANMGITGTPPLIPPQGGTRAEITALRRKSDAQVEAELAELRAMNAAPDPEGAEIDEFIPSVADDPAPVLWPKIESMGEAERYEELIRLDVAGVMIPRHLQAFMTYFEQTPAYGRDAEFYEEVRARAAVEYQRETRNQMTP